MNRQAEIADYAPLRIEYNHNVGQVRTKVPAKNSGKVPELFRALAKQKINLDMVVIEPGEIRFTAADAFLGTACQVAKDLGYQAECTSQCVTVQIHSGGVTERGKILAAAAKVLSRANIPVLQITEGYGMLEFVVQEYHLPFIMSVLSKELHLFKQQ